MAKKPAKPARKTPKPKAKPKSKPRRPAGGAEGGQGHARRRQDGRRQARGAQEPQSQAGAPRSRVGQSQGCAEEARAQAAPPRPARSRRQGRSSKRQSRPRSTPPSRRPSAAAKAAPKQRQGRRRPSRSSPPRARKPLPAAKGVAGRRRPRSRRRRRTSPRRAKSPPSSPASAPKTPRRKKGKNGRHAEIAPRELTPADVEARKRRLKTLIVLGKERGFLTYAEINDHLPDDILDAEQIEGVISMIGDMGIQVYDEAPDADTLLMSETPATVPAEDVEEEAEAAASTLDSEFGRTTDPVRMYMREMGSVELLTREGEIEIAKRIEEGLKHMIMAISACPMTVAQILDLADKIEQGRAQDRRPGRRPDGLQRGADRHRRRTTTRKPRKTRPTPAPSPARTSSA